MTDIKKKLAGARRFEHRIPVPGKPFWSETVVVIEEAPVLAVISELEKEVKRIRLDNDHLQLIKSDYLIVIEKLKEENDKFRSEIDKITNGIPSEWAYAILKKERDALRKLVEKTKVLEDACEQSEYPKEFILKHDYFQELAARALHCTEALKEWQAAKEKAGIT